MSAALASVIADPARYASMKGAESAAWGARRIEMSPDDLARAPHNAPNAT
jgi:hypothetical protein